MIDIDLARDGRTLFDIFEALADTQGFKRPLAAGEAKTFGDRLMVCRALNKLIALWHTPQGDAIASSFGAQPRLASHVDL